MPIRRNPASRSTWPAVSAQTRATTAPTVRQAMRISSVTALFEHTVASHATVRSKPSVCPAPCRAHGTAATTTPCRGQHTRGASASTNARTVPRSNARHRRRPAPRSYPGLRRRQTPHCRRRPRPGRTAATITPSPSSNSTRSTTVFSTPSNPAHNLALRTPFSRHLSSDLRQART
jgi:hypothetical protein